MRILKTFRKSIKTASRTIFGRHLMGVFIILNQFFIRIRAKFNNQINLVPSWGQGSEEHYFHFIFDLVLPLNSLIDQTSSKVRFAVREFGNLSVLLTEIFGDRVAVIPKEVSFNRRSMLMAMGSMNSFLDRSNMESLKNTMLKAYGLTKSKNRNKVLLINRVPADKYFSVDAKNMGSGSERRSIKNHKEFEKMIRSMTGSDYEFHNLQLEKMSMQDQVSYFDSAAVVIGQHGAGLANILWMDEGSIVIELGLKSKEHFKRLSQAKRHKYFLHNYERKHIKVDCHEFSRWLMNQKGLMEFFNPPKSST